jgi:hypothetical protein
MANLAEIIKDFIEIGYDYFKLHEKYAKEMEDNKHTLAVQDSVGHNAQQKLTTLNSMFKNGDLPIKPVEAILGKEVDNILTEDVSLKEKLEELKKLEGEQHGQSDNTPIH